MPPINELYDKAQSPTGEMKQAAISAQNGCAYDPEYVLRELFTYHPVRLGQEPKYTAVRTAARHFAEVILQNVPHCSDRSTAIRKIREAVMTANAAIALDGLNL